MGQCEIDSTTEMRGLPVRDVGTQVTNIAKHRVGEACRNPGLGNPESVGHRLSGIHRDLPGTEAFAPVAGRCSQCYRRSEIHSVALPAQKPGDVNVSNSADRAAGARDPVIRNTHDSSYVAGVEAELRHDGKHVASGIVVTA